MMDLKDLTGGTLCRLVQVPNKDGSTTLYTVGRVIRGASCCSAPGRSGIGTFNHGLHLYASWLNEDITIFANEDRSKIYAEVNKPLCVDEFKNTFEMKVYAELRATEWQILFSHTPPSHLRGWAIALVEAVAHNLFSESVDDFGKSRENSPGLFCDLIANYAAKDGFAEVDTTEEAVSEKLVTEDLKPLFETATEIAPVEEETPETDVYYTWASVLKGEHIIEYDWAPEAREHIPALSTLNSFVPTKEFITMMAIAERHLKKILGRVNDGLTGEDAIGEDALNFKLSGPPGSGKSFALKCLAAALGLPFWVTSFNPNSDESFAEGKTRMVDGEPKHTDAPLTMCAMYGGISAGEEPNTGDPEMIFGVYSQIVESPYTLYRNGSETVIRHPLSIFAILYNKNCGSATMHAALLNRFNQPFAFAPAGKDEFVTMLLKKSGSRSSGSISGIDDYYSSFSSNRAKLRKAKLTDEKICAWVYKAYQSVINSLDSSSGRDAAEAISLRSCYGLLQAVQDGEDPTRALRCLTDNIGDFDEELKTSIEKALNSALPRLM